MAVTADSYRVAFGKRLKHVIQSTVFEGGKGTCYVADFGWTDEPITDYYTNW